MSTTEWIEGFKLAIISEDDNELAYYINSFPTFSSIDEMKQAQSLIGEALILVKRKKNLLSKEMKLLRQHKDYLNIESKNRLDVMT